eukprot:gene4087-8435_t
MTFPVHRLASAAFCPLPDGYTPEDITSLTLDTDHLYRDDWDNFYKHLR